MLFTPYQLGKLSLRNRFVRSATADPEIYINNRIEDSTLSRYEALADGPGMIITGDFPVSSQEMLAPSAEDWNKFNFETIKIEGADKLTHIVHSKAPETKLIAQLATGYIMRLPSPYTSPFGDLGMEILTLEECEALVKSFSRAAIEYKKAGFDGVQIHAAHGGALALFLSPFTNTRTDRYGDPVQIFKEIRSAIAENCGDFPVLIKMNCTDYMPGGLTKTGFQKIATEIAESGYDALEVSGGIWDCLYQSEKILGFPPKPAAEAHTALNKPEKQSYFRPWIKELQLSIPIILVGGNRTKSLCNEILETGDADLISFCRPFITEPKFVQRWQSPSEDGTTCISCNGCYYELYEEPTGTTTSVRCVFKEDKESYKKGIEWGKEWVKKNFP